MVGNDTEWLKRAAIIRLKRAPYRWPMDAVATSAKARIAKMVAKSPAMGRQALSSDGKTPETAVGEYVAVSKAIVSGYASTFFL
jgi:hypothetical protein